MRTVKTTIKMLLAVAIAMPLVPAWAQFSRWTTAMHVDASMEGPIIGSDDGSTVVLMRYQMDPLRSLDGGVTWSAFNINGQRPYNVQIAPTNPKVWYAFGETDNAFYQSMDGGTTWSKRSGGGNLAISADPQLIYQGIYQKDPTCPFSELCSIIHSTIQVSSDGGVSWRDLRTVESGLSVYPSPVDPALLFSVGVEGISRSRDAGATWTVIVPPSLNAPYGGFAFDRFDSGIVYLLPGGGSSDFHGFVSHDAGTTWTAVALTSGGRIVADPVQSGRAFLFSYGDGTYETRDAGKTWVHVEPGNGSGINFPVAGVVMRGGQRFAMNVWDSDLRQLDLNNGALALASDTWWNPAQSGWGMSITHHSSTQTFVAWFAYGRSGEPVWRVIPGGQWNDRVFAGDVYETKGPAYFGVPFDPSKVSANRVGKATITFDDQDNATFAWQLDEGLSGNQRVVREIFASPANTVVDDNYADMWWNAAESGWGIAINHQYNNVFAAWYMYDAAGQPLWVAMPNGVMRLENGVGKASGALYRTHGPSAAGAFDPSQVTTEQVGTATLTFTSATGAKLDYTAFGVTESRGITRQPF
jgi:hypothetical protein